MSINKIDRRGLDDEYLQDVEDQISEVDDKIGLLSELETENKEDLVKAINEVGSKEIDTSTLATKTEVQDVDLKVDEHENKKDNPHNVTKEQLELSNVDNIKQASKVEHDDLKEEVETNTQKITKTDDNLTAHLAKNVTHDNVHGLRDTELNLGAGSQAMGANSVALGRNATTSKRGDVAIGESSYAFGDYGASVAIGKGARAEDIYGIALGTDAVASGFRAVAIGNYTEAPNINEGVLGRSAHSNRDVEWWVVPGNLTVGGTKNFEIPHPKPEKEATHRIRHGAVESPTAGGTLYRYTVESTKENDLQTINLPDYFIHLNKDVQLFVTPQGHFGNGYGVLNEDTEQLEIHCQSQGEYNVLVIGTRNDDHQSVQDWDIKGVEREIGESWTGETYVFSVDEIMEVEEIKEESA